MHPQFFIGCLKKNKIENYKKCAICQKKNLPSSLNGVKLYINKKHQGENTLNTITNPWTEFFFSLALLYASKSKDPSTKVGCVIAKGKHQISQGFNGLPQGIKDTPERLNDRDWRIAHTIHAERNAILESTKSDCADAVLYVTAPPCLNCCLDIIQVGIAQVCFLSGSDDFMARWGENTLEGQARLKEAEINILQFNK